MPKFELAEWSKIETYLKEVKIILGCIGHPEAMVTDESTIWDFTDFGNGKLSPKADKALEAVGLRYVGGRDFIWALAKELRGRQGMTVGLAKLGKKREAQILPELPSLVANTRKYSKEVIKKAKKDLRGLSTVDYKTVK